MTVENQIITAMVAALTGATQAGTSVFRSRVQALTIGDVPAIAVSPKTEESQRFGNNCDENILDVEVEIFVRGDPYDQVADPIAGQAHKLLTTDPGVAATVIDIRKKSRVWEADEADETAGSVITIYEVRYLTLATDLSVQM